MSRLLKYILLMFLGYQIIQFFIGRKKYIPKPPEEPPSPQNPAIQNDDNKGEYIEYEEIKE